MAKILRMMGAAAALSAGLAFGQGMTGGGSGAAGATESSAMGSAEVSPNTAASVFPDQSFAIRAAQGGMAEVEIGRIAMQNGSSDLVKAFGQRMVDEHGKANEDLKHIAGIKGIPLPGAISSKEKKDAARLQKLKGDAFDRAYLADMVRDHEKDVAEFEREARSGQDPELKAFAEKALPTLKEHLQMARDASAKVGAQTDEKKKPS